jgi:hypothetical protein
VRGDTEEARVMDFYLKSNLPNGHQSATGCRGLIIERQFIPISQGECDERSARLRSLLLLGAKRLVAQQCKAVGGMEERSCN